MSKKSKQAEKIPDDMPVAGSRQSDGTVCAGISPHTNHPMYVLSRDAPKMITLPRARRHAAEVTDKNGQGGFRVPSVDELNVIFQNSKKGALRRSFNKSTSAAGFYWAVDDRHSTHLEYDQRFKNGKQYAYVKSENHEASVRYVR